MSELTNTPRSSYARLFDTGNNDELSRQIGELFTHFQSQTIKQGNELEEYICEYINTTKKIYQKYLFVMKNILQINVLYQKNTLMSIIFHVVILQVLNWILYL